MRRSLGFRAKALHPRLYAAARIRGLRTRQNVGNDKALCCRPLRGLGPISKNLSFQSSEWSDRALSIYHVGDTSASPIIPSELFLSRYRSPQCQIADDLNQNVVGGVC